MKPRLYRGIMEYHSPYPESLPFRVGEKVSVGEVYQGDPAWENWVRCQSEDGKEAWIPIQFLEIEEDRGTLLRSYDARELSISRNEILKVTEIVNGFGMAENQAGESGWVPLSHVVLQEGDD